MMIVIIGDDLSPSVAVIAAVLLLVQTPCLPTAPCFFPPLNTSHKIEAKCRLIINDPSDQIIHAHGIWSMLLHRVGRMEMQDRDTDLGEGRSRQLSKCISPTPKIRRTKKRPGARAPTHLPSTLLNRA